VRKECLLNAPLSKEETSKALKLFAEHPGQYGGEVAAVLAPHEHVVADADAAVVVAVADVAVAIDEGHSVRTDAGGEDTAGAAVVHTVGMGVGAAMAETTVLARSSRSVMYSHRRLADPMSAGGCG